MKIFIKGLVALVVTFAVLVGIATGAAIGLKRAGFSLFDTKTVTSDERIVESIRTKQDITLLHVNVHSIFQEETQNIKRFSITIPDSDRHLIFVYRYTANLGIDGKEVSIEKTSDKSYTVKIPIFKVLGTSNVKWDEDIDINGALAFLSEEPKKNKIRTCLLSEETLDKKNLSESDELMREQAETFYSNIIHAIDPEIELTFEFTEQPTPAASPSADTSCSSSSNNSPSPSATATASSKKGN